MFSYPFPGVQTEFEDKSGSLYLVAGSPTRCQNDACKKAFEGYCIRGDNDRYYCCEVCAQIGMEIDFDQIAKGNTPRIVA